jgi:hypothetical protein
MPWHGVGAGTAAGIGGSAVGSDGGEGRQAARLDELDAHEEAHPAHVAHGLVAVRQLLQQREAQRAHARRVRLQRLVLDDREYLEPDGAVPTRGPEASVAHEKQLNLLVPRSEPRDGIPRDRVAAERVEVLDVHRRLGDRARRDHGREREAVAKRFTQRDNVGRRAVRLEAPPVPPRGVNACEISRRGR